jgi:hypothetical protein
MNPDGDCGKLQSPSASRLGGKSKMTNGNLVLNGISDRDLVIILEVKQRHEGQLTFSPQQMQPGTQGNPPSPAYNNLILQWAGHPGVEAVKEILHRLTSEEAYQPQQ